MIVVLSMECRGHKVGILNGCRAHFGRSSTFCKSRSNSGKPGGAATLPFWFLCPRRSAQNSTFRLTHELCFLVESSSSIES